MANRKQAAIGQVVGQPKDIIIEQPKTHAVCLELMGTAPLIQNAFSQKAVEQMLRKHMGITVQKETKKPREQIEAATIRNEAGRVCIPPTAFKKAMLSAAGNIKLPQKAWQLKSMMFVFGQSVPITYDEMSPRMDMVRTSGATRVPDVRFRPEFNGWKARVVIEFSELVSAATVVDLMQRGGTVGVGEWRPEKSGTFGTFRILRNVTDPKEVAEVREQCAVPLVALRIPEWALDADIDPELLKRIAGADVGEATGKEVDAAE